MKIYIFFISLFPAAIPLAAQYDIEVIEEWVVTDASDSLYTRISQPREDMYPGERFPAVVYVPGGLGPGAMDISGLAPQGFIEVHFNAPGRVSPHPDDHQSTGEEDHNGFYGQDALKAVIEYTMEKDNVDQENVGVQTNSFGITMGAGCLGRYPDLGIKYLLDVEGPSYDFVTSADAWSLDEDTTNDKHELIHGLMNHYSTYRDSSDTNAVWWSQRQALNFIDSISCYYLRLQAEWDHVQPPSPDFTPFDYPPLWWACKHTTEIADKASWGHSPWVLVNNPSLLGNTLNARYGYDARPQVYTGWMRDYPAEENNILKLLADMPACAPPVVPTGVMLELLPTDEWLLTWSPNSEPDLAGYLIYSGDARTRQALYLEDTVWAPDTFCMISGWEFKHSYAVRAFDTTDLRSDLSVINSTAGITETTQTLDLHLEVETSVNLWEVRFFLPNSSDAEINIYDAGGRRVKSMNLGCLPGEEHNIHIEPAKFSDGVYFVQLEIEKTSRANKIVWLR